jgi:ABC-type phosphate/phosphonate transport system substrate-binding protein/rhodanese-related sulfurtransferase
MEIRDMRRTHFIALMGMLGASSAFAAEALLFNVTVDYDEERNSYTTQDVFQRLNRHMSASIGRPVKLVVAQNAERVGERVRTGTYNVLLTPSQLVGEAMKHGYTPVAKGGGETRVVLIGSTKSDVASLEQAKGRRLVLPHRESLVTFVVNGEFNAMGIHPRNYFSSVENMRLYGAVLYALELGQADVVAVKEDTAREWLAKHPGKGTIIKTMHEVPTLGVAVSDRLDDLTRNRVTQAVVGMDGELRSGLAAVGMSSFEQARKDDFEYVSTLGYYTPRVLSGGTIVSAETVRTMLAKGVPLFDVRPPAQYQESHIPGARNLPYKMNSAKDVDFDGSLDTWDISRLPQNKDAPVIFQCNGAECWYSYKASRTAITHGYRNVHWFRGGLPEWKAKRYSLKSGA